MKLKYNGIFGCAVLLSVSCGDNSTGGRSCSAPQPITFEPTEMVSYLITDSNGRTDAVTITQNSNGVYNFTVNGNNEKIDFATGNGCSYPANFTGFKRLFLTTENIIIELNRNELIHKDYTEQVCENSTLVLMAGEYPVYGCTYKNNTNTSTLNIQLPQSIEKPARGIMLYEWRNGTEYVRAELTQWNDI